MGLQEGAPLKERRPPGELGRRPPLESQRAVPGGRKLPMVHGVLHEQRTSAAPGTSQVSNAAIKTPGPRLNGKVHQIGFR